LSTARVNLLPPELARGQRARRLNLIVAGLVVVSLLVLAAVYILKIGQVEAAREERDQEQAVVADLQVDLAALEEFRRLADTLEQREQLLIRAMSTEVSFATVLNDLSLSFPASSSLRTLTLTLEETAVAPGTEAPAGTAPPTRVEPGALPSIGTIFFEGYSVERFAPGVESVVLELDDVESFIGAYVQQAQTEEIGETEVTGFSGLADLDESAYTGRYVDGLPPGVEPE